MFTKEHALVKSIREWSASTTIGDDCAVLPGGQLLTTDTLVEGTHFKFPSISWKELGWKAIAVNLSDIAAMAGRPRHLLIAITMPEWMERRQFKALYQSMVVCADAYRVSIAGGDLTKGPALSITVTVLGGVHESGCLTRGGAQPGDIIAVTGSFGASAAGLWLLMNGKKSKASPYAQCLEAHLHPLPRLCEAWSIVRRTGSRGALMDASDGLADALVQIASTSGVGMEIDLEKLPINKQTILVSELAGLNPLDWALYGGEDYELVACIPPAVWQSWSTDNPFTSIGVVDSTGEISLKNDKGYGSSLSLSKCFEQVKF